MIPRPLNGEGGQIKQSSIHKSTVTHGPHILMLEGFFPVLLEKTFRILVNLLHGIKSLAKASAATVGQDRII